VSLIIGIIRSNKSFSFHHASQQAGPIDPGSGTSKSNNTLRGAKHHQDDGYPIYCECIIISLHIILLGFYISA
jgi:hypothetical protein